MSNKEKNKHIQLRVTEEQHRIIKEEAEENNTTMSALLLRRFENNLKKYIEEKENLITLEEELDSKLNDILKINLEKRA